MRLFVSINLSPEATRPLVEAQKELERRAPDVYKWTDMASVHLTLYFLGETSEEGAHEVVFRLNEIRMPELQLGWGGLVVLPAPDVPKILAAGVIGDVDRLRALQRKVHDLLFPIAENKETRAYFPHATIGRLKRGVPPSAKVIKRALTDFRLADGDLEKIESFSLVKSTLGAEGSRYETLEQFTLGAV